MSDPIVLSEYDSARAQLTFDEVKALRVLVEPRLSITAADAPGSWIIRANSYVGTVVAGRVRLLVRPKVSDANLFHLLEAGGEPLEVRPEVFEYQRTNDLVPSFATFFARVAEAAFGRGVHRAYEEWEEPLLAIRGRVLVETRQRQLGLPLPTDCRYDEYTPDIPLNRIVKAAASRLSRLRGVTSTTRSALSSILIRLDEVSPLRGPELQTPTVFTRLNDHYRPVERLARMVLQGTSILDLVGNAEAGAFLVDMNSVFEEFVEARLRHYLLRDLQVKGQQIRWLDIDHRVVRLVPDLIFFKGGAPVYVGDTKYKLLSDDGKGRNPDYYQLLAYTTALGLPEGVLIYCHDDGSAPQSIVVQNVGSKLYTAAIRLDGTPVEIETQLCSLANWILQRTARRSKNSATA
jgi:5-methylcytosine-specific restriction enzyme subunit McrC